MSDPVEVKPRIKKTVINEKVARVARLKALVA